MQTTKNQFGEVIDMTGHFEQTRFRAQAQVEAYWEALRRSKDIPLRTDIDPRGIEGALEYAFILEKLAPGLARLRVAGAHMSDVLGMEVRGMPISSFIPPSGRADFAEILETVTSGPAIARISLSAETGIGKPPMEARMLLLPLKSDFGDVNRVLGCFETQGKIGRAPRRFEIQRTEIIEVNDRSAPAPEHAPGTLLRELSTKGQDDATEPAGFSEPKTPFEHRASAGKRTWPSYLKLVKSDD